MADPVASGLWGLIRIDGSPLAQADIDRLGLPSARGCRSALGRDAQDPGAVDELGDTGGQTILTGWIAGPGELARQLGLRADTAPAALAQYPTKPIRMIVPYPPGGATDVIGRVLAQRLSTAKVLRPQVSESGVQGRPHDGLQRAENFPIQ